MFAESLLALLNGCCSQGKAGRQDKASFWTRFQQIRTRELVSVWRKLGQNLHLEIHPVIIQTISTNIFTSIIENDKVPGNQSNLTTNKQIELTAEERNIIQYASGYIAMKLIKKYNRGNADKHAQFVECLTSMSVDSFSDSEDSDFLTYISKWTKIVNRGGLFEINSLGYSLIQSVEMVVRANIHCLLSHHGHPGKESIVQSITLDRDVQFCWSQVSLDVEDEYSSELLHAIAELWLSIRGFSIASSCMEMHKAAEKKTIKKSKGLRKTLKKGAGGSRSDSEM